MGLFTSFNGELEKIASPQILKYLSSYEPDAARSSIQQELGLLMKAVEAPTIDEETKAAMRRRMDELNKADYISEQFRKSVDKYGKKLSPKQVIEKALEEDLEEKTRSIRRMLQEKILKNEITPQQAKIIIRKKAKENIPDGITEGYVRDFEQYMGSESSNGEIAQMVREDHEKIKAVIGEFPTSNVGLVSEATNVTPADAPPQPEAEEAPPSGSANELNQ